MITTEAWVLHRSPDGAPLASALETGEFRRETLHLPDLQDDEILAEPLYGGWEANMSHAISRKPIDVCRQNRQETIALGNAGIVRALAVGSAVRGVREGDIGTVFGGAIVDSFGYMIAAHAYDAPGTAGMLAKRMKLKSFQFLQLPPNNPFTPQQWAAYMVRYMTAWSNWRVAYGAYRLQMSEQEDPEPHVWGWGGGTSFAELDLARRHGCRAAMITSKPDRIAMIEAAGIIAVNRRDFEEVQYDAKRYASDRAYRAAYETAEGVFLDIVQKRTAGWGVAIFIDNIGTPVTRATQKALGRQGVLCTAGWKRGMSVESNRALECIRRHTFVHTHYARLSEWPSASEYSAQTGWMPAVTEIYSWDDIPALAAADLSGALTSYFPVFAVNPV